MDNIYQSVPEKVLGGDPNIYVTERTKVLLYLRDRPNTDIKSIELAKASGFPINNSQAIMRREITRLQLAKVPILGTRNGYQYTLNPADWDNEIKSLQQRIQGLQRRIKSYEKIRIKCWDTQEGFNHEY
jgi:transcriptional regulator of NAD metabolism